ncbi:MAG: polysulfide reductase [Deltaproteobacteria bacterium RBG_16_58_17]|nr:MAG: polysulfide reductase [Deltaproteobacteria bacterium RBG_16_58_17]OHE18299.1 MAG: polysulfide reductase [Syntrophobacterales bacterium GWC2_56_13]OHE21362.1 MAG: polysulfide reductase [Syntrophobacterales bacterium GWF2_56_9]
METAQNFAELAKQVVGFIYPNEIEIHWSILIVVYPYITGLVAGAFILASLVKVFNVKELQPTYRLALLTALAFLLIAPLPLQLHLGQPWRSYEIFLTPNLASAMAMFGFVYLWYLMVVLLLEIWFEYRRDMIVWSSESTGLKKWVLKVLSLFSTDISEKAVAFDKKTVKIITIIGIPSAFLLHGYVGFIFGSIKANPWWSSVMMPVVFLFSAIVSGIAIVMFLYMIIIPIQGGKIDMKCLDKVASFLFYAVIVDFSIEVLDFIHRLYESEESIKILSQLVSTKLFMSLVVLQILLGMLLPLGIMVVIRVFRLQEELRKLLYFVCVVLIQMGIFSTRWNVVIGGQLFSKSFRGLTTYKMELTGIEGLLVSLALLIIPFVVLAILIKLLPPWKKEELAGG